MIAILLPAYNEGETLPRLLNRLSSLNKFVGKDWKILIVNDGSTDGTRDAALRHRLAQDGKIIVVDHDKNRGLARAMETGINEFIKLVGRDYPIAPSETDILITMDADDTHDPEYIPELIERIRKGADVVIASRFCAGGSERGVSAPRRFLSRGVILFMRLAAPVPGVRDYSCGYRAYAAKIIHTAANTFGNRLIETAGFSVMTELLIKLAALGARIEEIPFTLHYDRKVGKSKIKLIPTLKGYFAIILIARRIHKNLRKSAP